MCYILSNTYIDTIKLKFVNPKNCPENVKKVRPFKTLFNKSYTNRNPCPPAQNQREKQPEPGNFYQPAHLENLFIESSSSNQNQNGLIPDKFNGITILCTPDYLSCGKLLKALRCTLVKDSSACGTPAAGVGVVI